MGDVDEGGVDLLAQLDDLGAHLVAELGVEVGQRLVHQEDLRVPDDGAADGDTLPLAAGQRLRLTVEVLGDIEDLGGLTDLAVDLRLRGLLQLQGEGHVIINGHVGIQSIVLEDHGDIAVLRGHIVHELAVDIQLALGDLFETCDHAQRGGLAAAGRADEDDEFLVRDVQVEFLHGDDALIGDLQVDLLLLGRLFALLLFLALLFFATDERVDLLDVYEFYFCHSVSDSDCAASAMRILTTAGLGGRIATCLHNAAPGVTRTGFILLFLTAGHHKCGLVHSG